MNIMTLGGFFLIFLSNGSPKVLEYDRKMESFFFFFWGGGGER